MARAKSPATLAREEIERRFTGNADIKKLALKLQAALPEGRHKSLAMTALQECMLWAGCAAEDPPPAVEPEPAPTPEPVATEKSSPAPKKAPAKKAAAKRVAKPTEAKVGGKQGLALVKNSDEKPRRVTRTARA